MVNSPCNGICRIIEEKDGVARCISCKRDYDDLAQWLYLSEEARLYRMNQLKEEQ